jgi:multidrug transporter EmrE-like cation transporter
LCAAYCAGVFCRASGSVQRPLLDAGGTSKRKLKNVVSKDMRFCIWVWLAISILFEVGGDYFVKYASNTLGANSKYLWAITLLFYNLMLIAWMIAIHGSKQITIPGTVWLVCGQLALVVLGICFFGEQVTAAQKIGVGLSILALAFLGF